VTWEVRLSKSAARALTESLPEGVAAACFNFLSGALAENPLRVGRQLQPPLWPAYSARRGDYRVVYRVLVEARVVEVMRIEHRRDAYRV
jgi:mRNA interferase RelE/StbE